MNIFYAQYHKKRPLSSMMALGLLIVFCLSSFGCSTSNVKQSADFLGQKKMVQTTVLMKPSVHVMVKNSSNANVPSRQEEEEIASFIEQYFVSNLDARGYIVTRWDEVSRVDGPDPSNTFFILHQLYDQLSMRVYQPKPFLRLPRFETWKSEDEAPKGYSIGKEVNLVSRFYQADALLFVRYNASKRLPGKSSSPMDSHARLEIALIDAHDGHLLWSNFIEERLSWPAHDAKMISTLNNMIVKVIAPLDEISKPVLPKATQ